MLKKAYTTLVIIGLVAAASMVITHLFERDDEKKDKEDCKPIAEKDNQ